jgi:hypothetical protein
MNPNSTTIESHARVEARMCSAKASVELMGRRVIRSSSGNGSGYQPGEGLIGSIVAPAYAQNRVKRHAPSPSTSPADLSVPERDPRCRLNFHDHPPLSGALAGGLAVESRGCPGILAYLITARYPAGCDRGCHAACVSRRRRHMTRARYPVIRRWPAASHPVPKLLNHGTAARAQRQPPTPQFALSCNVSRNAVPQLASRIGAVGRLWDVAATSTKCGVSQQ